MADPGAVQHYHEAAERQFGFAAAVRHGRTLTLSGLISVDEQFALVAAGDIHGQIDRIYDAMEAILARSGAGLGNVVNEMIFVTDMAELVAGSPTRLARYADCAPPATTAVQVSALFVPGALIEIQATVELPGG